LSIDDDVVVSNLMPQTAGELFLRNGSTEERGKATLTEGRAYRLTMDWSNFHQTNPRGKCMLEAYARPPAESCAVPPQPALGPLVRSVSVLRPSSTMSVGSSRPLNWLGSAMLLWSVQD
jgi:hypothetical protein